MAEKKDKKIADEAEDTGVEEAAEGEFTFVEDPSYDVNYEGECAYVVKVSVPAANEAKQAEELFDELASEVEVRGFRRGRAPRRLIERKFGKVVKGETTNKIVSSAFRKLIKDQDLHPIDLPDIEGLDEEAERPEGEPLTFTLKFEVAPKVELGTYRGIKIERPVFVVDQQAVDETLANLRSRFSVFETVTDAAAQDGDQVFIDFEGKVGDEDVPGGSAKSYPYVLGTKRFFPEFEEVLRGSKAGEEKTCTVSLPDDHVVEKLRGKKAVFTIKVNEIKRRNEPELNDDLAKLAGYENREDMLEKVRAQIEEGAKARSNSIAEARALSSAIEASTFEIPKSLIQRSAEDYYQEEIRRLVSMRLPMSGITERDEELRDRAQQAAMWDIKRTVFLNEVVEAEGLEVTDDDYEQEIALASERSGVDIDTLGAFLNEDEERRNSYESRILRNKAVRIIMDNAEVTDKKVTREEAEQIDEDSDA